MSLGQSMYEGSGGGGGGVGGGGDDQTAESSSTQRAHTNLTRHAEPGLFLFLTNHSFCSGLAHATFSP